MINFSCNEKRIQFAFVATCAIFCTSIRVSGPVGKSQVFFGLVWFFNISGCGTSIRACQGAAGSRGQHRGGGEGGQKVAAAVVVGGGDEVGGVTGAP